MLEQIKQNKVLILLVAVVILFFYFKINDGIRVNSLKKEVKSLESDKQLYSKLKLFWEDKAKASESDREKVEEELKIYKDSLLVAKTRIKYIKKYYDEKIVDVDSASLNTSVEFITNYYR